MSSPEPTRFLPGRIVGRQRFRIIQLLGKGAMGEVYLADDLELGFGERVALKFLPEKRQRDAEWLRRFRQEIQIARKVAHPNVCRVYDLDKHDGALILTMECIDGEDLSRLLRRFGRDADGNPTAPLPAHRALGNAHQICAGLAAIHDRAILHRDLKPSNVIIDDRGTAKITDFGLAAWVGQDLHADEGTVPYMAPEQLAGEGVTERSDIYSLGLVLYELFTGQRAFDGKSRQGLVPPGCVDKDLDPQVGEAIMLCLREDPRERPASARRLAGMLPDPADCPEPDHFPPPEILLVPDPKDRVPAGRAWIRFAALALGLLLVTLLAGRTHLQRFVDPYATPEVLALKAREMAADLGYGGRPGHVVRGFAYEPERLAVLERLDLSGASRRELAAGAMSPLTFWYRESPSPLIPFDRKAFRSYDDPPATAPGTVGVQLAPDGRLRRFEGLPPDGLVGPASNPEPDWSPLIAAAGLSPSTLDPVRPELIPTRFADRRVAWRGSDPGLSGSEIRIEAAALSETPVSARVLGPESEEAGAGRPRLHLTARRVSRSLLGLSLVLGLAAAIVYAQRNIRRGRDDRTAALRLAIYVLGARMAVWLFGTDHVLGRRGLKTFWSHLPEACFFAGCAWILYVALEPLLRRDWPGGMTSWVRLMHGRFRDPRVGRDVLLGAVAGAGGLLAAQLAILIPAWLGKRLPDPSDLTVVLLIKQNLLELQLEALRGLPNALAATIHGHAEAMLIACFGIFGLFALRFSLRKGWLAVIGFALLMSIQMLNPTASHTLQSLLGAGVIAGIWLTVLLRFGFLPAVLMPTVAAMLATVPLTLDLDAWYAPGPVLVLLAVLGVGAYGFVVSLGGRPLLPEQTESSPPRLTDSVAD